VKLLLADDEAVMRRGIALALTARGYEVDEVSNGEDAVSRGRSVDVVLLDVNMPGLGGISACRQIRSTWPETGIIMITVRDSEDDIVEALEAGADDYVIKPFRIRELLARIAALLRRSGAPLSGNTRVLKAGKLELSQDQKTLKKDGVEIHLSPIEFNLLEFLMQHEDTPLEHAILLRTIWGPEYGQELEYLRTYIRLIRRKIEDDPARPQYLVTEPWLGYRFRDPALRPAAERMPTEIDQ
jgi:two-component system, OmpR family, KDP operon response regulator KdpE